MTIPKQKSYLDVARAENLNWGMFRQRTIKEVERIRDNIAGKEDKPKYVKLILEGLADLSELCIDREILSRTSIGKLVSKLNKHNDITVSRKAGELLQTWKHDHERRQKAVDAFVEKGRGVISKRNAMDMEDGLFDEACPLGIFEGDAFKEYQRNFKRLCTHLRATGAGSLIQQLEERTLRYTEVAKLPDSQLMSDQQGQKKLDDKEAGLKSALASTDIDDGVVTDRYMCPKCQSWRCKFKDVQSTSVNDNRGLTMVVRCLDCRNFWKETDDAGLAG